MARRSGHLWIAALSHEKDMLLMVSFAVFLSNFLMILLTAAFFIFPMHVANSACVMVLAAPPVRLDCTAEEHTLIEDRTKQDGGATLLP